MFLLQEHLTYEDVTNVDSVGIVTARSGVYFGSPTVSAIITNSATTTTDSQTSIDSFSASTYRSAKYQVQITRGSEYQVTEISIVHDGSDSYGTEYATLKTGATLSTFSTDISGGNVRLLATPSSSSSTVFKFTKTAIVVMKTLKQFLKETSTNSVGKYTSAGGRLLLGMIGLVMMT